MGSGSDGRTQCTNLHENITTVNGQRTDKPLRVAYEKIDRYSFMLTTEAQAHERNYEKLALFGREDTKLRGGNVRNYFFFLGGGGVGCGRKKKTEISSFHYKCLVGRRENKTTCINFFF